MDRWMDGWMKGWMFCCRLWVAGSSQRIAYTSLVYPLLVVYHILESVKGSNLMLRNYKTRDHPLQAIVKGTIAYYSTMQKDNESIGDYALALENRLTVYKAVGGTVMNVGVKTHIAEDLYKKAFTALTTNEKKIYNTTAEERVTAMVLFGNACKKGFGKLQDEIQNDHLKGSSTYSKTIAGVTRLLTT
jgi:hypothetical protein